MAVPRPEPRLIAAAAGALVLLLAAIGLIITLTGDRGLTPAQYERLVTSGSLAGVPNDVTYGPGRPIIDLDQQRASYLGAARCTTYWSAAQQHLLSQSSHLPVGAAADESLVQSFGTELWDDPAAAQTAMTDWTVCLDEFQSLSPSASAKLKVVARGTASGVAWQYSANFDFDSPLHLLILRDRNVIATFDLPDAPDPGWRAQLAEAFHADVEAASRS